MTKTKTHKTTRTQNRKTQTKTTKDNNKNINKSWVKLHSRGVARMCTWRRVRVDAPVEALEEYVAFHD